MNELQLQTSTWVNLKNKIFNIKKEKSQRNICLVISVIESAKWMKLNNTFLV